jgi:DNA-binding response OmpR family regulator
MKTILVLDDQFDLLNLACRLLQSHGYRTLQASNAEETLGLAYDELSQVELFVVDVCLAADSGIQVAVALRADFPDLPILLVSGYPINSWSVRDSILFKKLGGDSVRILQKPFTPQLLMATIGEMIGAGEVERANSA